MLPGKYNREILATVFNNKISELDCEEMKNNLANLDEIDEQIIKRLQENSRSTIADIAREIGELTENAIRYRIEKIENEGYIDNYTIRLNPKKFGKNITAIINLNVLPENINSTLDYLKSIDCVTQIYLTTGDYSIITIGYFENNNAVTNFITNNLKEIDIINYDLITVLQRVKHGLFGI